MKHILARHDWSGDVPVALYRAATGEGWEWTPRRLESFAFEFATEAEKEAAVAEHTEDGVRPWAIVLGGEEVAARYAARDEARAARLLSSLGEIEGYAPHVRTPVHNRCGEEVGA